MRFLNPCNDVAFKKIFGSENHKDITISFLNSVLENTDEKSIQEVQFLNTEQKRILKDKKENILDILCTDQAGNKYLIEVQVERAKEFGKRIVFYASKTYALQLGSTESYTKLKPVVAIAVLDFILFPEKKAYKSIHSLIDEKTGEQDLKELRFVFIELDKFVKTEAELVTAEDKWIYFLKNIKEQDHIPAPLQEKVFKEACDEAQGMTWSEEEHAVYDYVLKKTMDTQAYIDNAREEGLAKGQARGEILGRLEEKRILAQKLFAIGVSLDIIMKTTELTRDELKKIIDFIN